MKRARYALLLSLVIFSLAFTRTEGGGTDTKSDKIISTFEVRSFKISNSMVSWTSVNEHGSLPYIVEQYIFDKWVKVGEVSGVGNPAPNSYSVPVILSSGENKFRVRQKGYDKISRFSDAVTYYSKKEPVSYEVKDHNQTISFSSDTYFIIYNPYGAIVKQGYGNSVNISEYAKGYYCLIYDNKLGGFDKKKVLFKNSFCPVVIDPPNWMKKKSS
ncbi:MAG: hypothetical protein K0Q95_2475 [Bacteroidota bacterium]|jgi:hypothetical protein|nr:hypothetical protein [Bacteroidota bacterium]